MASLIKTLWASDKIRTSLALVGVLVVVYYLAKLAYSGIQCFRLYFFSQVWCWNADLKKKYGKWVIVTGATDGIGLAMARWFARKGHSIMIVGRNSTKLAAAQESLAKEPNVGEIVTVKIDLSDSSLENFESIRAQLDIETRDIGILVNNAGMLPGELKRFHKFDMAYLREIVNLNILATVFLTRMVLPRMLERQRGLVVNVSSLISYVPGQFYSVYAPTKNFLNAFGDQLRTEYYNQAIDIVTLTPGMVFTKAMNATAQATGPSFFYPSTETYANAALNALSAGVSRYSGTIMHAIFGLAMKSSSYVWLYGLIGEQIVRRVGMRSDFSTSEQPKQLGP